MTRMLHPGRALAVAVASIALAAAVPRSMAAQAGARQQGVAPSTPPEIGALATQLGLNAPKQDDGELSLGASFTGTLDEPAKLAHFGIGNMHKGARVTMMRVAPDKLRVEADEMDPAPARGSATLKLAGDGSAIAPKR